MLLLLPAGRITIGARGGVHEGVYGFSGGGKGRGAQDRPAPDGDAKDRPD